MANFAAVTHHDQQQFLQDLRNAYETLIKEGGAHGRDIQVQFYPVVIGNRLHYSALLTQIP